MRDLIEAFGRLQPHGWELVIAGNDDDGERARSEALAERQPNAPQIRFAGPVADARKWELYRSADLFVLPSYSENFGIVIGEALACGVPVLTTTATPWGEYAVEEASRAGARAANSAATLGLKICAPGEASLREALAEAIAGVDALSAAARERGADWIRERFSWAAIGAQFLAEIARKD